MDWFLNPIMMKQKIFRNEVNFLSCYHDNMRCKSSFLPNDLSSPSCHIFDHHMCMGCIKRKKSNQVPFSTPGSRVANVDSYLA